MTKRQRLFDLIGLTTGAILLGMVSACSDGSLEIVSGGDRNAGASVGPVSGFGSVFVNGVEFDTDGLNGAVSGNDGVTTECGSQRTEVFCLREGMILRVEGEWRTAGRGTADSLEYDDTFRGQAAGIALSLTGERLDFSIYGQALFATTQTVFSGTTMEALANGDFVRVSAFRLPNGRYRASFIGVIPQTLQDVEIEVNPAGGSVDAGLNQFESNGYTVTYDESVFAGGITESDLEDGGFFEVEGRKESGADVIVARAIQREDFRRYVRGGGDDIELTGPIQTSYEADGSNPRPGEFNLGGLTVRITSATELDDELTLARLQSGLLVRVAGTFTGASVAEAARVELLETDSRSKGLVEGGSVDLAGRRIEVGGVTIQATPSTILVRDDGAPVDFSQLSAPGTEIEALGMGRSEAPGTDLEAFMIKVASTDDDLADNEFELEGRLAFISRTPGASALSILGITMSDSLMAYDGTDKAAARQAIVDAFEAGQAVVLEVEYRNTTVGFVATEVELESEDDD